MCEYVCFWSESGTFRGDVIFENVSLLSFQVNDSEKDRKTKTKMKNNHKNGLEIDGGFVRWVKIVDNPLAGV